MECASEAGPGDKHRNSRAHSEWDWCPTRSQCPGGTQNGVAEHGSYKQHSSRRSRHVLYHESPPTPGGLKHVIPVSHSSGSWQVLTCKQWLGPESFRTLAHTGVLCLKLAVSRDHSRHRWPARLHVASVWLGLPHAMATGFPGRACQENWAELCHLF